MPWQEVSVMDRRREFVDFAKADGANLSLLCRQFGISRKTGYKWLARYQTEEPISKGLSDRSRRPRHSPGQTTSETEQAILKVRDAHPAWGGRKIAHCLKRDGVEPPAISTVHAILTRHGRISAQGHAGKAFGKFERAAPNELWQMDFKGQERLGNGDWCYPLTVIDDHSRFSLCLEACDNQQTPTVKALLEQTFRRYGLPAAFYVDNGSPWGGAAQGRWTPLTVWLLKLNIGVIYATPYCPQGRGKNERFHRSLKAEVFAAKALPDKQHAQRAFDAWRHTYNHERPHESLAMASPVSRYSPSPRQMPRHLPIVEYDSSDILRKVCMTEPRIAFRNQYWRVPRAFKGETVAVRPIDDDSYGIYFGATKIAKIDLKTSKKM